MKDQNRNPPKTNERAYSKNPSIQKLIDRLGQLSIATSKNPSVMNTICINSFRYTHVITSTKFRLKQAWRLTKAMAEMKCDTEQTMKLE